MGAKFDIAISNIWRSLTFPYLVWYRNGELLSNRKRGALTKIMQNREDVDESAERWRKTKRVVTRKGKRKS